MVVDKFMHICSLLDILLFRVGQNGVWGSIGLYLCFEDTHSQGAWVKGHGFITFGQKLTPESSHLSGHFCNSVWLAETWLERKVRVCGTVRTSRGNSIRTGTGTWKTGSQHSRGNVMQWAKCRHTKDLCNSSGQRNEGQMNRPQNKETLCCLPVQ
jgi:hypothetical protein